jgi:hypothetical protein
VASAYPRAQNRIAHEVLAVRRVSNAEVIKIIDEAILRSPINIYVAHNLLSIQKASMDNFASRLAEIKVLVPKIKDALVAAQIGHFKLGEFYSEFNSNSTIVGEILHAEAVAEILKKKEIEAKKGAKKAPAPKKDKKVDPPKKADVKKE